MKEMGVESVAEEAAPLSPPSEALDWLGRPVKEGSQRKLGGPVTSIFILANQGLWNISYLGVGTQLVLFLTRVMREGNAEAANNVTNWFGTMWITTLIGGFLGDSYWGRFWTCVVFQVVHMVGMVLLSLTLTIPSLKPPPECNSFGIGAKSCPDPSPTTVGLFYFSLYVVALGAGGYLPAFQALGADQYDNEAQKTRFFNWLFFFTNVGSIFANTVFVYIENQGRWGLAFWLLTAVGGLATLAFMAGIPFLRQYQPAGNPLTRVAQVLVATARKWNMKAPTDPAELHDASDKELVGTGMRKIRHTSKFRCFDKAAIDVGSADRKGTKVNPWRLSTVTQVEEMKVICRISPIWFCGILFFVVFAQIQTFFVEQAATMDNRVGKSFRVPPASISVVGVVVMFAGTLLYDVAFVPLARKLTGKPYGLTQLQRMGVGQVISIIAMIVAALVEMKRLTVARLHGLQNAPPFALVPISIFWLVPQHFFLGLSQVILVPAAMDFFYNEAPHSIRGMIGALSTASLALGSYCSSILVSIVVSVTKQGGNPGWIPLNLNRGHLDYFYWLLLAISTLNFVVFIIAAHWYKYTNNMVCNGKN